MTRVPNEKKNGKSGNEKMVKVPNEKKSGKSAKWMKVAKVPKWINDSIRYRDSRRKIMIGI